MEIIIFNCSTEYMFVKNKLSLYISTLSKRISNSIKYSFFCAIIFVPLSVSNFFSISISSGSFESFVYKFAYIPSKSSFVKGAKPVKGEASKIIQYDYCPNLLLLITMVIKKV